MSHLDGRRASRVSGAVLAVAAVVAVWTASQAGSDVAPGTVESTSGSPSASSSPAAVPPASTVDLTPLVVVDDDAPRPYERAEFGQRWADVDRNGCDQRNDVLARDLVDAVYRPGTRDCVVERGTLTDPYTGELVRFEKVDGGIDIDHVVPLAAAWRAGAWSWTEQQRTEFANDPANLQATSSSVNRSKGDQGVDEWLPPDPAYTCSYATRWVQIKTRWSLTVTSAEKTTLEQLLERC